MTPTLNPALDADTLASADRGGALLFSDGPGHINEGFLPAFNALNMFAVPQQHQVGFISPFAGAHRFSVTGWFLR